MAPDCLDDFSSIHSGTQYHLINTTASVLQKNDGVFFPVRERLILNGKTFLYSNMFLRQF
jgi:hypothetical protein